MSQQNRKFSHTPQQHIHTQQQQQWGAHVANFHGSNTNSSLFAGMYGPGGSGGMSGGGSNAGIGGGGGGGSVISSTGVVGSVGNLNRSSNSSGGGLFNHPHHPPPSTHHHSLPQHPNMDALRNRSHSFPELELQRRNAASTMNYDPYTLSPISMSSGNRMQHQQNFATPNRSMTTATVTHASMQQQQQHHQHQQQQQFQQQQQRNFHTSSSSSSQLQPPPPRAPPPLHHHLQPQQQQHQHLRQTQQQPHHIPMPLIKTELDTEIETSVELLTPSIQLEELVIKVEPSEEFSTNLIQNDAISVNNMMQNSAYAQRQYFQQRLSLQHQQQKQQQQQHQQQQHQEQKLHEQELYHQKRQEQPQQQQHQQQQQQQHFAANKSNSITPIITSVTSPLKSPILITNIKEEPQSSPTASSPSATSVPQKALNFPRRKLQTERERPPKCMRCKEIIFKAQNFLKHVALSDCQFVDYEFKCCICKMSFMSKEELKNHESLHMQNKFFCQRYCGKYFDNVLACEEHENNQHEHKRYVCNVCTAEFPTLAPLKNHMLQHNYHERFDCAICRLCFQTPLELHQHIIGAPFYCGKYYKGTLLSSTGSSTPTACATSSNTALAGSMNTTNVFGGNRGGLTSTPNYNLQERRMGAMEASTVSTAAGGGSSSGGNSKFSHFSNQNMYHMHNAQIRRQQKIKQEQQQQQIQIQQQHQEQQQQQQQQRMRQQQLLQQKQKQSSQSLIENNTTNNNNNNNTNNDDDNFQLPPPLQIETEPDLFSSMDYFSFSDYTNDSYTSSQSSLSYVTEYNYEVNTPAVGEGEDAVCCVRGCGVRKSTSPTLQYFFFPKDEKYLKQWIHNLKLPPPPALQPPNTSLMELYSNHRICSLHFPKRCISRYQSLFYWAVPTFNLGHDDNANIYQNRDITNPGEEVRCSMPGCDNQRGECNLKFFKFPSNSVLFVKWCQNARVSEYGAESRYFCSRHFEDRCFGKYKLKPWAVPTKHLGNDYGPVHHNPDYQYQEEKKCCLPHCRRARSSDFSLSLYRFPRDDMLLHRWCHNLRLNPDLYRGKNHKICSAHFVKEALGLRKLSPGAVPTLNLGHNDSNIYEVDLYTPPPPPPPPPSSSSSLSRSLDPMIEMFHNRTYGMSSYNPASMTESLYPFTSNSSSSYNSNTSGPNSSYDSVDVCCVPGCNQTRHEGKITLHTVPRREEQKRKWCHNLKLDPDKLHKGVRVCSAHFEKICIGGCMRPFAVPTLNLGHNDPNIYHNPDNVKRLNIRETCCVQTCKRNRDRDHANLHRFPSNPTQLEKWCQNLRKPVPDGSKLFNDAICEVHFEDRCLRNKRLEKWAIPTLNLGHEDTQIHHLPTDEEIAEFWAKPIAPNTGDGSEGECCVETCRRNPQIDDIKLYRTPEDPEILSKWAHNLQLDVSELASLRICNLHFQSHCIGKRLHSWAIPTLNLGKNVENLYENPERHTVMSLKKSKLSRGFDNSGKTWTPRCCLPHCRKTRIDDRVQLFRFPHLSRKMLAKWCHNLQLPITSNKHRRLCSSHFEPHVLTKRCPMSTSVPTLNLNTPPGYKVYLNPARLRLHKLRLDIRCVIPTCRKTRSDNVTLFRYPQNRSLLKKWCNNTRQKANEAKRAQYRVCSLHFEPHSFGAKRLVPNAIPTLNLGFEDEPDAFIYPNEAQTLAEMQCVVANCESHTIENDSHLRLFKFPIEDEDMLWKWCNNLKMNPVDCKGVRICQRHFEVECLGTKSLFKWAIPTLQLGHDDADIELIQLPKPEDRTGEVCFKCCVPTCGKTRKYDEAQMNSFPKTQELFDKWKHNLKLEYLDFKEREKYKICNDHFEKICLGKTRLNVGAIPTLNLGHEDTNDLYEVRPEQLQCNLFGKTIPLYAKAEKSKDEETEGGEGEEPEAEAEAEIQEICAAENDEEENPILEEASNKEEKAQKNDYTIDDKVRKILKKRNEIITRRGKTQKAKTKQITVKETEEVNTVTDADADFIVEKIQQKPLQKEENIKNEKSEKIKLKKFENDLTTKMDKEQTPSTSNANATKPKTTIFNVKTKPSLDEVKCCVAGCGKSRLKHGVRLFPFPNNATMRKKWCRCLQLPFPPPTPQKLRICNLHFQKRCIDGKQLRLWAIPSLNLHLQQHHQPAAATKKKETVSHEDDMNASYVSGFQPICCVPSCGKQRTSENNLRTFGFPKDDEVLKKWCANLNLKLKSYKGRRVCINHFELDVMGNRKLKTGAVPTLNLGLGLTQLPKFNKFGKAEDDFEKKKAKKKQNAATAKQVDVYDYVEDSLVVEDGGDEQADEWEEVDVDDEEEEEEEEQVEEEEHANKVDGAGDDADNKDKQEDDDDNSSNHSASSAASAQGSDSEQENDDDDEYETTKETAEEETPVKRKKISNGKRGYSDTHSGNAFKDTNAATDVPQPQDNSQQGGASSPGPSSAAVPQYDEKFSQSVFRLCCLKHCRRRIKIPEEGKVRRYSFPKDPALCRKWAQNLGLKPKWCANTSYRICSRHFEKCVQGKTKLKPGAVPTVDLGPGIKPKHANSEATLFYVPMTNDTCTVPQCGTAPGQGKRIFQFPSDKQVLRKWCENLKLKTKHCRNYKICERHFEPNAMRTRLCFSAVPTLHLGHSDPPRWLDAQTESPTYTNKLEVEAKSVKEMKEEKKLTKQVKETKEQKKLKQARQANRINKIKMMKLKKLKMAKVKRAKQVKKAAKELKEEKPLKKEAREPKEEKASTSFASETPSTSAGDNPNSNCAVTGCEYYAKMKLQLIELPESPVLRRAWCKVLKIDPNSDATKICPLHFVQAQERAKGKSTEELAARTNILRKTARVQTYICSVPGCGSLAMDKVQLWRLPQNELIRQMWLANTKIVVEDERFYKYRVCDVHFERTCFRNERLRPNAVPTLRFNHSEPLMHSNLGAEAQECCVPGCQQRHHKMFSYPARDTDTYEKWCHNIFGGDLHPHQQQELKKARICKHHFEPYCYSKRGLRSWALPTLNLHHTDLKQQIEIYTNPYEEASFYMCCVSTCRQSRDDEAGIKLYSFPRNETLAEKWHYNLRTEPNSGVRVCTLHFESHVIGKDQKLHKNALPTRNLGHDMKNIFKGPKKVEGRAGSCYNTCYVPNCGAEREPGFRLYSFPENSKILEKWRHNLRLSPAAKLKYRKICSRHFEPECLGERKLRLWALPTLQLGHNGEDIYHCVAPNADDAAGTENTQLSGEEGNTDMRDCCIATCMSALMAEDTGKKVICFNFPTKTHWLYEKWCHNTQIELSHGVDAVVCDMHFEKFAMRGNKLRPWALPTLHLGHENFIYLNEKPACEEETEEKDTNGSRRVACAIATCSKTEADNVKLFQYPSKGALLRKWAENCKHQAYQAVRHRYRICSAHFEPSCLTGKRLRKQSVPTVDLGYDEPPKHRNLETETVMNTGEDVVCVVPFCGRKKSDNDIIMFKLPEPQELREKWCHNLKIPITSSTKPRLEKRVCSRHFEERCITNRWLKKRAVPTLNLGHSDTGIFENPESFDRPVQQPRCCVPSCGKFKGEDGVLLSGFPKQRTLFDKWISNLRINGSGMFLNQSYRICSEHFEESCYEHNRLIFGAIPTLKLGHNDDISTVHNIRRKLTHMQKKQRAIEQNQQAKKDITCCYPGCVDLRVFSQRKCFNIPKSVVLRKIWCNSIGLNVNNESGSLLTLCAIHFKMVYLKTEKELQEIREAAEGIEDVEISVDIKELMSDYETVSAMSIVRLSFCAVVGCSSYFRDLQLYKLPWNKKSAEQWAKNGGFNGQDERSKVCALHFESFCFIEPVRRTSIDKDGLRRLRNWAIPTLRLPGPAEFLNPEPETLERRSLGSAQYTTNCCMPCCKNHTRNAVEHGVQLFNFPQNEMLFKKWLDNTQINQRVAFTARICALHFEKHCYNKRLTKWAVPTLFLGHNNIIHKVPKATATAATEDNIESDDDDENENGNTQHEGTVALESDGEVVGGNEGEESEDELETSMMQSNDVNDLAVPDESVEYMQPNYDDESGMTGEFTLIARNQNQTAAKLQSDRHQATANVVLDAQQEQSALVKPKLGPVECIVPNCDRDAIKDNVHFFEFPAEESRCHQWLNNLSLSLDPGQHYQYKICSAHFEPECITQTERGPLLHERAVPTLNLSALPPIMFNNVNAAYYFNSEDAHFHVNNHANGDDNADDDDDDDDDEKGKEPLQKRLKLSTDCNDDNDNAMDCHNLNEQGEGCEASDWVVQEDSSPFGFNSSTTGTGLASDSASVSVSVSASVSASASVTCSTLLTGVANVNNIIDLTDDDDIESEVQVVSPPVDYIPFESCNVPNCNNNNLQVGVVLYGLPTNENFLKIWLLQTQIDCKPLHYENIRVCNAHFEAICLIGDGRLSTTAIPTLRLPSGPISAAPIQPMPATVVATTSRAAAAAAAAAVAVQPLPPPPQPKVLTCSVLFCENTSESTSMHRFPENGDLFTKWCYNLKIDPRLYCKNARAHDYVVCSAHFESRCQNGRVLTDWALPTLRLGHTLDIHPLEIPGATDGENDLMPYNHLATSTWRQ